MKQLRFDGEGNRYSQQEMVDFLKVSGRSSIAFCIVMLLFCVDCAAYRGHADVVLWLRRG